MLRKRIIACLDVVGGRVVKGVNFVDLADAGDPVELAKRYSDEGADEIAFLDIGATPEGRETLADLVERTARQVFVPLMVGGGIRSVANGRRLLNAGADKLSVNSAVIDRPELITELSDSFGSQAVVLAIDAKRQGDARWQAFGRGGRSASGLDAVEWAIRGEALGGGEILLTSMDADGVRTGFDELLTQAVSDAVGVPVIASGGAGLPDHFVPILRIADAALAASIFHDRSCSIPLLKTTCAAAGLPMR